MNVYFGSALCVRQAPTQLILRRCFKGEQSNALSLHQCPKGTRRETEGRPDMRQQGSYQVESAD